LRNLHGELVDTSGQLLENRHALFQAFYTSFKGLRRHDVSIQISPSDDLSWKGLNEMYDCRADATTLPSSPSAGKRPK
jgi:hypothetical protein